MDSTGYHSSVHRTYISSLERGERNVGLHAIQRLADGFGISVQTLTEA